MAAQPPTRGRWVAIVTGALSVLIGVIYLVLITVLDSRGPMRPPPPEALAGAEAVSSPPAGVVRRPDVVLRPEMPSGSDRGG